jgi:PKD repeat protein
MEQETIAYATTPVATGKLATCVAAIGADPKSFGGINLVVLLQGWHNATTGSYGQSTWDQAWAMIGLRAAGETLPTNAAPYLESLQNSDGGWEYSPGYGSDTDSTGLALQALATAGNTTGNALAATDTTTSTMNAAFDYLRATQNEQGGWNGMFSATSASSTAYAIQGLVAAGADPASSAWSMVSSSGNTSQLTVQTPFDALHELQSAEGGFQGYSGANDPMASYQALPGVKGVAFPLVQPSANVQAAFTATPLQGTAPLAVTFTNSSSGDYTENRWSFGDGEQSWLMSPTHTYTQSGVFTATLTVSGAGGTAIETAVVTVQAAQQAIYLPLIQRSATQ